MRGAIASIKVIILTTWDDGRRCRIWPGAWDSWENAMRVIADGEAMASLPSACHRLAIGLPSACHRHERMHVTYFSEAGNDLGDLEIWVAGWLGDGESGIWENEYLYKLLFLSRVPGQSRTLRSRVKKEVLITFLP